ncbi:hypothetical protein [Paratractidigestivibacter sp.]|uniref:hypothetical protein n=1 Tax=Paratractidigestivibacter sp. TaxID=2847316 RepID=UPI002ABDE68A|nr:hypothetical protein [Paratractidigestivibacter sp.]
MKRGSGGNVRIGIVSFITLVSVLLLAMLAVLCTVSANAAKVTATRQSTFTTKLYEVDGAGQALVAAIDEKLEACAKSGESASIAAGRVQVGSADLQARALELSGADDLQISLTVSGQNVSFSITGTGGRFLDAQLTINDDLSYTLQSWKTSTTQTASEESLWGGASTAK